MSEEMDEKESNIMVERSMQILDFLSETDQYLGISEIAKKLAISKATVFRILNALEKHKAVEKNANGHGYKLGIFLIKLGKKASANIKFIDICKPIMIEISQIVNETVTLGILQNDFIFSIFSTTESTSVFTTRSIPFSPLHCSSIGKAHLAYFKIDQLTEYFSKDLKKQTKNTIVTLEEFIKERDKILNECFSYDKEEYEEELYCIAISILDPSNKIIAGISVSGLTNRLLEKKETIEKLLFKAKIKIESYSNHISVI